MRSPFLRDPDVSLFCGDACEVLTEMPAGSVDCCVTSPPYWGLRDYGSDGQLGLEATPDAYVARMVQVFRDVRRVLADHGTLWLNLGDSYAGNRSYQVPQTIGAKGHDFGRSNAGMTVSRRRDDASIPRSDVSIEGLKPKDLVGIPWRGAFALQADGWYLRSDIVWSKPNPMPESVTDRPTKSHEYVFLLSKSPRYFFDQEAVREGYDLGFKGADGSIQHRDGERWPNLAGRNVRSVWEIATQPYTDAHFATFPEELVRRCILAGCPEWVCGTCGKPRERLTEREPNLHPGDSGRNDVQGFAQRGKRADGKAIGTIMRERFEAGRASTTLGWSDCGHGNYRPGVVLDPFMGSGTTALVARKHGRHAVGIDLNPAYLEMAARRLQQLSLLAEGAA